MLRHQAILLTLLLVVVADSEVPAQAAPSSVVLRATTSSDGVRLGLIIPRSTYPANALVGVQISVRNMRSTTITLLSSQSNCGSASALGVQVVTADGEQRYPPALKQFAPLCPGPAQSMTLNPGQSVRQTVYAVLRARYVQARVSVETMRGGVVSQSMTLRTPPVTVRLETGVAPRIIVRRDSRGVFARVTLNVPHHGPLLYVQSIQCDGNPNGGIAGGGDEWSIHDGTRISASCSPVSSWQIIAGWIGHPVSVLNYSAP